MKKLAVTWHSPEFHQQSVLFFKKSGLTFVEAVKRLSLPNKAFKNWFYADRRDDHAGIGKHNKILTERELGLTRLKCELAEIRMERGFIKKCAAYFRSRCEIRSD